MFTIYLLFRSLLYCIDILKNIHIVKKEKKHMGTEKKLIKLKKIRWQQRRSIALSNLFQTTHGRLLLFSAKITKLIVI